MTFRVGALLPSRQTKSQGGEVWSCRWLVNSTAHLIAGHLQGHELRVPPETDTPVGWEIAVCGCMIALHCPLVGLVSERNVRMPARSWVPHSFSDKFVMEGIERCVCAIGETFYAIVRQWCVVLLAACFIYSVVCCRGLVMFCGNQILWLADIMWCLRSAISFDWGHGVFCFPPSASIRGTSVCKTFTESNAPMPCVQLHAHLPCA
mmetsp:Transcript_12909/g.39023  ORF Transcript_12909/g.39023 Transcript_12909/m.39023 type:complete len:206 (-) Transcript_12909:3721-4338(-)